MKSGPRCPDGHGPMHTIATDQLKGRRAAEWGTWWACPERGCDATYLDPSILLLLAASQPIETTASA